MKTRSKILILIFAVAAILLILCLPQLSDRSEKTPESAPRAQVTDRPETYTVKEHNGKIAVFLGEAVSPLYLLESPYVRDLPEYDRELLKSGITAQSKTELLKILEDYDY